MFGRISWLLMGLLVALVFGGSTATSLRGASGGGGIEPARTHQPRLRLTWGGGAERTWRIIVRASDAAIYDLDILSLHSDAPGSMYLENQALYVDSPTAMDYGGVEFSVDGYSNTKLSLEFESRENPAERVVRTISLEELTADSIGGNLDNQGNRFLLTRSPGDQLQVKLDRPHLIFEPGEAWNLRLIPHLIPQASKGWRCVGRITPARQTTPVLQTFTEELNLDQWGTGREFGWEIAVPRREGVYDLTLEFENRWYQASLGGQRWQRKIQFVVVEPHRPSATPAAVTPWRSVEAVRFASSADSAPRLNSWDPWRWLDGLPTSSSNPTEPLRLAPGNWQAAPLKRLQPHTPHLIEVTYQSGSAPAVGLSILQPDVAGHLSSFGVNSGLAGRAEPWFTPANPSEPWRHQMVFWPNRADAVLLVANRHATEACRIEKIEVFAGPERLPSTPTLPTDNPRQLLAFFELPLFSENFAGDKARDPETGESLDDWETFYQSTDRLIQFLKQGGYRGLMLSVNGQGGALFPSEFQQPTPRYDTGRFFSTGQDPVRKDVLELMFRMFAREGLELVPALTFSSPLPRVEAALRQPAAGDSPPESIVLRDFRQQPVEPTGNLPRYNVLAPTVQQAMSECLGEVLARYQHHENFSGISVLCRPDTYALLPGKRWGFELETVTRFYRQRFPDRTPPTAENLSQIIAQELLVTSRREWLQWRSDQISQLYRDWENQVAATGPSRQMYLAGVDLFRTGDLPQSLSPSLHAPMNLQDALNDLGWRPDQWQLSSQTVALRPHRVAPTESLTANRLEWHLDHSRQLDEMYPAALATGDLFVHRDAWVRWQNLPAAWWSESGAGRVPQTELFRRQPLEQPESTQPQRWAEALFRSDTRLLIEGGWTLEASLSPARQRFAEAFAAIPAIALENVPGATQRSAVRRPVAVRQTPSSYSGPYTAYVVNSSPFPVQVELQFSDAPTSLQAIPANFWQPAGDAAGVLELPPFGLCVLRGSNSLVAPAPRLVSFSATLPPETATILRKHLHQLQNKLTQAQTAQPLPLLTNSDFAGGERDFGWTVAKLEGTSYELMNDPEVASNQALKITSTGPVVWTRSHWFSTPATGRLTVAVWLKNGIGRSQPPLRVAIESDDAGIDYYRFGTVGSLAQGAQDKQLEGEWKQFVVHFDDLPLNPGSRLRVGFDLMGEGEYWIDRVELYDRWFDKNELQALTQLLASIRPLLTNPDTWDEARFLLEGYWPQFLHELYGNSVPGTPPQTAVSESPPRSREALADESAPDPRTGFMFRKLRRR